MDYQIWLSFFKLFFELSSPLINANQILHFTKHSVWWPESQTSDNKMGLASRRRRITSFWPHRHNHASHAWIFLLSTVTSLLQSTVTLFVHHIDMIVCPRWCILEPEFSTFSGWTMVCQCHNVPISTCSSPNWFLNLFSLIDKTYRKKKEFLRILNGNHTPTNKTGVSWNLSFPHFLVDEQWFVNATPFQHAAVRIDFWNCFPCHD